MLHCDQFWDQNTDLKSNAVRLVDSFAQSWTPPTAASGLNLPFFQMQIWIMAGTVHELLQSH